MAPRSLASKTNQRQREVAKATGTSSVASVRVSVVLTMPTTCSLQIGPGTPA
jgi:hypothetical protein